MQSKFETNVTRPDAPEEWGDCWAACLASVLEIDAATVPNPNLVPEGGWFDQQETWLRKTFGLGLVYVEVGEWFPIGLHLIMGTSPRGPWQHTVVGRSGAMVHDPHPSGDGLAEEKAFVLFTVMDPAKGVRRPADADTHDA